MGKVIAGVRGGYDSYTSKEFTITGAQTNYNVGTQQAGSFASPAEQIIIRTDVNIVIRVSNSNTALATAFDGITVTAAEGFDSAGILANIVNLYITTTANTAIKLLRVPGSGN